MPRALTSSDSMSCGKACTWDRCVKIRQIAAWLNILPTRMQEIVHDTSGYRKVAKCCVPGKWCECHKQIMGLCLEHLTLYEPISGVFLNHTVTGYETQVQHFTVETKIYSMIENMWTPFQQRSSKQSTVCAKWWPWFSWMPVVSSCCGLLSHKWDSHRRTLLQDAGQTERSCWEKEAGMVKFSLMMMWHPTQPGWPTSI